MHLQWRNQFWQSLEEGAGKRCSERAPYSDSKHWFTTSFLWRKVPESGARSVSLVRGIRRLREYQKQNGEYGKVCKVEDSHRDKTFSQCPSADRAQTPSTGLRHPSSKEEGAGKRCSEPAPYLCPMPPSSFPAAALIQQFENKECVFPAGRFLFVHRGYFVEYP